MKAIILFLLFPFSAISQENKTGNFRVNATIESRNDSSDFIPMKGRTGVFSMNGIIVTRNDSTEITDFNGIRDTCTVKWLSDKVYRVDGRNGAATCHIYQSGSWGYRAKVTDGKRTVWVEMIRVRD